MAFDLVNYFSEQITQKKHQLFSEKIGQHYNSDLIHELNILVLGRIVYLYTKDEDKVYQQIEQSNPLYVQSIIDELAMPIHRHLGLTLKEIESLLNKITNLQLTEIGQLNQTSQLGQQGVRELLLGQIEHSSGRADDWVWKTNQLDQLIGSKKNEQPEEASLDSVVKEFKKIIQTTTTVTKTKETDMAKFDDGIKLTPNWSKLIAPLIALVLLIFLYTQYLNLI